MSNSVKIWLQSIQDFNMRYLCLFGVDEYGQSACVRVLDFKPTILVSSTQCWSLCDPDIDSFIDHMYDVNDDKRRDLIDSWEVSHMQRFVGFTNHSKEQIIVLHMTNIFAFYRIRNYLAKMLHVKTYHDDFKFANQYLHQTGYKYQDWLECVSDTQCVYQICSVALDSERRCHSKHIYKKSISSFVIVGFCLLFD